MSSLPTRPYSPLSPAACRALEARGAKRRGGAILALFWLFLAFFWLFRGIPFIQSAFPTLCDAATRAHPLSSVIMSWLPFRPALSPEILAGRDAWTCKFGMGLSLVTRNHNCQLPLTSSRGRYFCDFSMKWEKIYRKISAHKPKILKNVYHPSVIFV